MPTLLVLIAATFGTPAPGGDDVTIQAPGSGSGGTVYGGAGMTVIAAKSPGAGLSYDLALELGRGLLLFNLLGAAGVHEYGTALIAASAGMVLAPADRTPYVVGGVGYLARGVIGGDSSAGPRRDQVVLTVETGYIFGRARRWGQIWTGVRVMVPVATTSTQGSPPPDFPWGILTIRFLL